MKKRIALAAAIALAISVGGMLPAFAAKLGAPTLAGSSCAVANGEVEVKVYDGDVAVSVTATDLVIAVTGAAAGSGTAITNCTQPLTGLKGVSIKATEEDGTGTAEGNVSIDLEGPTAGLPSNYGSVPMSIQVENVLTFNGGSLGAFYGATGTITEEGFLFGTVTGSYYAASVVFTGGAGMDVVDGSAVTTTPLTLNGGAGDDTLKGGALGDTLTGGEGNDVLYGNGGNDTLNTSDTESCDYGSPSGNPKAREKYYCTTAPSGVDEAWGGVGNDTINPGANDTVAPGDGNDVITGSAASLIYSDSSAAIAFDLTVGKVVKSTAGNDTWTGTVLEFTGSAFADTMVGSTGADSFYGGEGADVLVGYAGADFLSGNGGTDVIKGGLGADELWGDTGADKINGGGDDDVIYGNTGDDILYGSFGDDILRGQKGSDQAWGGRGTMDVCAAEVTDSCEFKR